MTDSIIERAARAIAVAIHGAAYGDDRWQDYPDVARAVLQAIREPSKDMLVSGMVTAEDCVDSDYDSGPDGESHNEYTTLRSDAPSQIWQSMINAALEEG